MASVDVPRFGNVVNISEPVSHRTILYEIIGEPLSSGALHKRCISPLPGIAIISEIGSGADAVWANTTPSNKIINEILDASNSNARKLILFENNIFF